MNDFQSLRKESSSESSDIEGDKARKQDEKNEKISDKNWEGE